jgi:sec-independent protein translocase protein TatB
VLDIGWTELLVIIVVAVVVVGPKDLPRMMRVAGQWMGRARAMADQFRRSFDDMARPVPR